MDGCSGGRAFSVLCEVLSSHPLERAHLACLPSSIEHSVQSNHRPLRGDGGDRTTVGVLTLSRPPGCVLQREWGGPASDLGAPPLLLSILGKVGLRQPPSFGIRLSSDPPCGLPSFAPFCFLLPEKPEWEQTPHRCPRPPPQCHRATCSELVVLRNAEKHVVLPQLPRIRGRF